MPNNSVTDTVRIIAIDPGFDRCGVAIVDVAYGSGTLVYSTCITTDKTRSHAFRITTIYRALEHVVTKWHPTALAVETLFFSVNKKTALAVAEARGAILLLAGMHNLELIELSPQEVKLAMTGSGTATKAQVQKMASLVLKIDLSGKLDDEIDAISVGFAAIGTLKTRKWST